MPHLLYPFVGLSAEMRRLRMEIQARRELQRRAMQEVIEQSHATRMRARELVARAKALNTGGWPVEDQISR